MPAKSHNTTNKDQLRNKLKLANLQVKNDFSKKFAHVDKQLREKGLDLSHLRNHSAKIIGAGVLAGAFFLAGTGALKQIPDREAITKIIEKAKNEREHGKANAYFTGDFLSEVLTESLPDKPRPLNRDEEKYLEQIVTKTTGVPARATLEGEHLNTTYGYIGLEQHLRRYPGDTLHDQGVEGRIKQEGMAPGLGAWGYFAPSKDKLTPELADKEKWYAVVQTLYLSDWNSRQPYLKNWYKYRKVLIVNTQNGHAVVADIADSGPAAWTGKHFGGSPEVMDHLGGPKYTKGKVLILFVDDPENKVPLGPVNYDNLVT